jgi:ribosomal protein S12 methylthiotransferase
LVVGVGDLWRLDELVERLAASGERQVAVAPPTEARAIELPRVLSTPPHRAYLKIADGCSNDCAYCIIGRLRGPFRSRAWDAVLAEARELVGRGVIELSLVAQDLTRYGLDLRPEYSLVRLLRSLDEIESLRWLRLLYVHPARVDEELVRTMLASRTVVPYLDVPLQHVSDRVLALMNRPQTRETTERVVALLRETAPHLAIRTTFLLGHPGETEDDVAELLDFMRRRRFDHVGAFAWSPEEGTPAYALPDRVDPDVARERVDRVMAAQQEISREHLREKIGQTVDVLIEEVLHKHDETAYSHVGRIPQQAPEVDGVTYVRAPAEGSCREGQIVRAKITTTDVYDLFGDLV